MIEIDIGKLETVAFSLGQIRLRNKNAVCLAKGCDKKAPNFIEEPAERNLTNKNFGDGNSRIIEHELVLTFKPKTSQFLCLVHKAFWKLAS